MMNHPVDIHVGKRLKEARMEIGISQEEVGEAIGVTFQQVQKYEKGTNRLCASKLYQLGKMFDKDITFFFDNFGAAPEKDEDKAASMKETVILVRAFNNIASRNVRKKVISLLKAISEKA